MIEFAAAGFAGFMRYHYQHLIEVEKLKTKITAVASPDVATWAVVEVARRVRLYEKLSGPDSADELTALRAVYEMIIKGEVG